MFYSADMLKYYRIDENSIVVCLSFNIFRFHLKLITVGCNANYILSCNFHNAIVNYSYNNHVWTSYKETYSPIRGEDYKYGNACFSESKPKF